MPSASASAASLLISSVSPKIRCCEDTLGIPRVRIHDASAEQSLRIFPEKSSLVGSCPRPRRIILVRHGQSEGNVDESVYTMVPDPKIKLTPKGWEQSEKCGKRIREMIERDGADDWKVYFYVSPYLRTLETLRGLGRAFDLGRVAGVREEPRLREQDFGTHARHTVSSLLSTPLSFDGCDLCIDINYLVLFVYHTSN